MPAKPKKARSKKQADRSLKLVLKRLDTFDQRFDALDPKINAVDQKVDALDPKSTQRFDNIEQRMEAGFRSVREDMVKYYSQLDRKIDDMEKAAAIDKIAKEIDKMKAA